MVTPVAIRIRAVRGFEGEQKIPLSPTLTVIYGENGRGKTSLCEGWNWLYTGEMLQGLEPRSELGSAARNIHAEVEPRVRLLDVDSTVLMERSSSEFSNPADLPQGTSPVLLQYRLHQVLYSSQGDRRDFFEDVLELDVESGFAQKLRRACQRLDPFAEDTWNSWRRAVEAVAEQGFDSPYGRPSTSAEQQENEEALFDFLGEYFSCESDAEALEAAVEAGTGRPELPLEEITPPISEEIDATIQEALSAIEDLDAESERALDRIRWQREGLDLVEPPECPFCGESTADEERVESIRERIEEVERRHESHREARSTFTNAVNAVLPLVELDVETTAEHLERLRASVGQVELEDSEPLLERLDALEEKLDQLQDVCPEQDDLSDPEVFTEFSAAALAVSQSWLTLVPQLESLRRELEGRRVRVRFVEAATSLLRYQATDRERFYNLLDAQPVLAELADAAPNAVEELKQTRLDQLADEIVRFYRVLRPDDLTPLKEIRSAGGVRGDIRIMARSKDQVEHASALFSHSNANALGMAAHIARILDAGHSTLVLDDPFQSLDDSNRRQVIENLVEALLEEELQVVILTHQRRSAQKLLDRYVDCGALGASLRWDRETGPVPEPLYAKGDRQLAFVLGLFERDAPSGISGVADSLRNLIEGFCSSYLTGVNSELPHARRRNLGGFIDKLERLPIEVKPNSATFDDLREWNRVLSEEGHYEGDAAPGMDELKEIARRALEAQKHQKQLRPPDLEDWNPIPRAPALRERMSRILGVD